MSNLPDENLSVRYTAKELFARIDSKLDFVIAALVTKADVAHLEAVEERVAQLERREAERTGFGDAQKAVIGLLIVVVGLLIPIVLHYLP